MRRFVLGTAGHVDHGKTSLVRALTGVDTDRLPEEKRRGITIELGFAPWHLAPGVEVSIVDVPGHRRLVHTMIAGAIGIELVLLVVAADEGVMPQTREHIAACEILGLRRGVVAITKLDRVGADVADLAAEEVRELLGDRWQARFVSCSSRTGEGIDRVREAVQAELASLPSPRSSGRARLGVDRVFSIKGAGTVVTGTLVEGRLAVGSPLFLVGEQGVVATAARGLHVHDHAEAQVEAPTRLAVNLAGVALEAVRRGDLLTDDKGARPSKVLDVELRGVTDLKPGATVQVYVGTARSPARADLLEGSIARLRLSKAMPVLGGDRFVLRGSRADGPEGAVLGGGDVLDATPPRRKSGGRLQILKALARGDAAGAVRGLVAEAAPAPLPQGSLASRFSISSAELRRAADALVGKGELAVIKGAGWMNQADLASLARLARSLVADHHKKAPLDRGLTLETLRQKLAARAGAEAAEEAIRIAQRPEKAAKTEPIVVEGDVARTTSFAATAVTAELGAALSAAERALAAAGLKGVTEFAMKEATGASPRDVKAIFAKLVREGVAVHAGDLWFAATAVAELRTRVAAHLAKAARLTIAEFKDLSGLGRKQAILLLELFDREGVTIRSGDDRLRGPRVAELTRLPSTN